MVINSETTRTVAVPFVHGAHQPLELVVVCLVSIVWKKFMCLAAPKRK